MELPKNVTQIGESDKNCKVYVEDYVVSYIKQLNHVACNKDVAVALYGNRKVEQDVTYIFIYGACKLDFIQREIRHLSQAQRQEIEKLRRKHFAEQEFQGYRFLNGEMVEGFHIYEQDICRYVSGYAQFYEKNEAMLGLMLASRAQEVSPEVVSLEKYDTAKMRREERREEYYVPSGKNKEKERKEELIRETSLSQTPRQEIWKMRVATATVFALLCLTGIAFLWDEQNAEKLQETAGRALAELTEQKLPDMEISVEEVQTTAIPNTTPATAPVATATAMPEITASPEATDKVTETPSPTLVPTATAVQVPASYTIQQGDTLIGICISKYGSDARVREICALNDISDPDDIKMGQTILLPVQ